MSYSKIALKGLAALFLMNSLTAQNVKTIEDYNQQLPYWGASWAAGSGAVNGYYPSFYTGFAMRSENPDRIHVRLARGNQTRVTVILDEDTVTDYLFDLVKRNDFYKVVTRPLSKGKTAINVNPSGAKFLPQMEFFNAIINSPEYGIAAFVKEAKTKNLPKEVLYSRGLKVLQELNPGRVFVLNINLTNEFRKWKEKLKALASSAGGLQDSTHQITAINSLLWGRINFTEKPSAEILSKLQSCADLANGDESAFLRAAVELFKLLSGEKYNVRSVSAAGTWQNALQCADVTNCKLSYPEFTTLFPTGSVKAFTRDQFGNSIPLFATPGLWPFVSRGSREVDNIRDEPYYGWAPKMDYEAVGNGYHNPAVRFRGGQISKSVKENLGISASHDTFWSVMRGGVSHGCSRLPLGHVWEMRHIFPVENSKMVQIYYFGNKPTDFDVYDIDGDGTAEVMGVEYLISYDLQGGAGEARREGKDLEVGEAVSDSKKLSFYTRLYGSREVFTTSEGKYLFQNPTVSLPSYLDLKKHGSSARVTLNGTYALFEQKYERDKVQFYQPFTTSGLTASGAAPLPKRLVRILGRVRGCSPYADKAQCGEAAFDNEANSILRELGN